MDISVFIDSHDTSSERRISPSWTVAVLKQKLWPITGIPPESQRLSLPHTSESDLLSSFAIEPLSVIKVDDARPKGQRENYTDDSKVDKFELSKEEYEARNDSVLAYKKRHQIGRFDPNAPARAKELEDAEKDLIKQKGITVGARCQVGHNRGTIRYVGEVPEIPKPGLWIGIEYDEPVGKNDGSMGRRYFDAGPKFGGFMKADKLEVGDFPNQLDEDLDEI